MLNLRVVQARIGDCLILENGSSKQRKYVLVDGGPDHVYGPYLRDELKKIGASGGKLDLVVLTHMDNDHVLGLLEMMAELKDAQAKGQPPLIQIGRMWHNGFAKIVPSAGAEAESLEMELLTASEDPTPDPAPAVPAPQTGAVLPRLRVVPPTTPPVTAISDIPDEMPSYGVNEGYNLQLLDSELGVPRNPGFPDGLVMLESAPRPIRVAGIKFWVLGPSRSNLEQLRKVWQSWMEARGMSFDVTIRPDTSKANLSSIMLLVQAGKRRILLTGDGRGDDVVNGLEQSGLLPSGGTIHVDILKIPHHGSARNAVGSLFNRVLADTYVISSAVDIRYNNPDIETLVWLVEAACRQNRDIKIVATNNTPALEKILELKPPAANHYTLEIMQGTSVLL